MLDRCVYHHLYIKTHFKKNVSKTIKWQKNIISERQLLFIDSIAYLRTSKWSNLTDQKEYFHKGQQLNDQKEKIYSQGTILLVSENFDRLIY